VSESRPRWTKGKLRELNLILWAVWDPIEAGVPLDEYESYAPRVANLLEKGADAATVAEAVSDIRSKQMRADRDPPRSRRQRGRKIDRPPARSSNGLRQVNILASRKMSAFRVEHRDGEGRAGILTTAHGVVRTPAFLPVGTKATVKLLVRGND
jgi:hypothetical protein